MTKSYDDRTALLSVGDAPETEGGSFSNVDSRSGRTDNAVSADYQTQKETAVVPSDFTAVTRTFSFAGGQTSKAVVVATADDVAIEGTEGKTVLMPSRSSGAHILDRSGTETIKDNDVASATPSIANVLITEGGALN